MVAVVALVTLLPVVHLWVRTHIFYSIINAFRKTDFFVGSYKYTRKNEGASLANACSRLKYSRVLSTLSGKPIFPVFFFFFWLFL